MTDFDKNYVFISVCSEDLPRVEPILQKLGEKGLNYWVYEVGGKKSLRPGEQWQSELYYRIRSCSAFFAFLSNSFFSHKNCTDELWSYRQSGGENITPVQLDENLRFPEENPISLWIYQFGFVRVEGYTDDDIVNELFRAKGVSECIYKKSSEANVESFSGKYFQEAVVKVGCKILHRVGGLQEKEPRRYLLGVVKTISNGDKIEIETDLGQGTKSNKSFSIGNGIDGETLSLKLEDYHQCPICQYYYIKKEEEMCGTCFDATEPERRKKINIIKQYFEEHVKDGDKPYRLDDEQLGCLITNQNTLIEARAGSGKTRTLVAKIIDLVARQGLGANEFLSFCFNKNARVEIQERLFEKCKVDEEPLLDKASVKNAIHTFHSFSLGATSGEGLKADNILFQDKEQLVKDIICFLYDNESGFSGSVMRFFEQEFLTVEGTRYESGDDFLDSIRHHSELTMMNENVETAAEKHIADFLLENGLDYSYNPRIEKKMKDGKYTKYNRNPCSCFFVGKSKRLTIEFWLCNGEEPPEEKKRIETEFHINYNDHLEQKGKSNNYWKVQDERCIILDNSTLSKLTKQEQQELLERKLSEAGFPCIKLTEDEIRKKVWPQWQDDFCELISNYINRYQTNCLNDALTYKKNLDNTTDKKIQAFHLLAKKVYDRYLNILENNNIGIKNGPVFSKYDKYLLDGNQLIDEATKVIQSGKLDERIRNLKWVLIDEFQDFSKLFYELIRSILDRNPEIKLFCVGDPWQSINRFAGSDVEYFDNFGKFFSESSFVKKYITNNYRSSKKIVCYSNNFMERMQMKGKPSNPQKSDDGFVVLKDICNAYAPCTKEGDEFFWAKKDVNTAKNAKAICDFCKDYASKNILILCRTKLFSGKGLLKFKDELKDNCKLEIYDISTVHVKKGSEADTVIIMDVKKGGFPLFNSNELLFTPFEKDNNPKTVLRKAAIDEIKLYYVALTRAKKSLCIIFDSSSLSPFIKAEFKLTKSTS